MARRVFSKAMIRVSSGPVLAGRAASVLFLLLSLIALTISTISPSSVSGMRQGTIDLLTPTIAAIHKPLDVSAEFVRSITGLSHLQDTNAALLAENKKLTQWYHTALTLQSENDQLRALLNYKTAPHHRYISSFVIADTGQNFVKSLVVPVGEFDGAQRGQAVVTQDGLVGRLVEVGANASRVLLLSDVNSRVPVLIEALGTHAILAGTNGDHPVISHLPPGTELKAGQRIVTSGHGGVLPRSIPVGVVHLDESGTPYVQPYTNRASITHVKIIDNSADPYLRAGTIR